MNPKKIQNLTSYKNFFLNFLARCKYFSSKSDAMYTFFQHCFQNCFGGSSKKRSNLLKGNKDSRIVQFFNSLIADRVCIFAIFLTFVELMMLEMAFHLHYHLTYTVIFASHFCVNWLVRHDFSEIVKYYYICLTIQKTIYNYFQF